MNAKPELMPHFGDIVTNGWASEDNPNRTGFFIREVKRSGKLNPGKFWELTDGHGGIWQSSANDGHKLSFTRPATAVAVKPLEWQRGERPDEIVYTAESITGLYIIRFDDKATDATAWMLFISGEWVCFDSFPAAQAGAQADYERRILSALSPQPPLSPQDAAKVLLDDDYAVDRLAMAGASAGRHGIATVLRAIAGDSGHD